MSNLIIFDLDGVITSEESYWDAAGLTLHELCLSPRYWNLTGEAHYLPVQSASASRQLSRSILPTSEIVGFKARAINSNWDTCYAAVCLRLIDLLAHLPNLQNLLPLAPWKAAWLALLRDQISTEKHANVEFAQYCHTLPSRDSASNVLEIWTILTEAPEFSGYVGLELINRFDEYASNRLGFPIAKVYSRYSPFWTFCQDIFQEWYLGDELYEKTYGHAPQQTGKPGTIHFEQPLLSVEQERETLEVLREEGYVLGFATGRVRQEAEYPLKLYGLLPYFDEQHTCTYDIVEKAEAELGKQGDLKLLGKPNPFQFLVAANTLPYQRFSHQVGAGEDVDEGLGRLRRPLPPSTANAHSVGAGEDMDAGLGRLRRPLLQPFIVVGDSTSDIIAGHAAGAITIAVLTGAATPDARKMLEQSEPDFIIDDMTKLPDLLKTLDSLGIIQHLQFTEREKAEQLLRLWFAKHMHLAVESVTLTPKAVSLNSFNGFYKLNGEEYFFKTHVEEQGVLPEYYHAELLHEAGYNIVMPLQTLHEQGRQMVIYPVIHWPVMFDLMRTIETSEADAVETVVGAEKRVCERLLTIYESTLAQSSAEENARAPIHQLFWHRVASGRLDRFYTSKQVLLPVQQQSQSDEKRISFEELLRCRWTIHDGSGLILDGNKQQITMGELIERARIVLNPSRDAMTVIGHGDAHYGNVFLQEQRDFLYFDPAFAGRHSPLLDIVKPLFHNVFATWMYFPHEVAQDLQLSVSKRGNDLYIEHTYEPAPVRWAILQTKVEQLLQPLKQMLHSQGCLPDDWHEILTLALMCCPLLTVNLLDRERMPPKISWLGLSYVIQMGNMDLF